MNTLRDRIAAAIRGAASDQTYWVPGPVLSGIYADAVIRELNLTKTAGVIVGCNHDDMPLR